MIGEKGEYGAGVILDSNIFDGVRPRAWGQVLGKYVYEKLAGTELAVYDENSDEETIYLARENDRVTKDGAKNSHKVIDKLARYRGDNIRALATVHISEALATSKHENTTAEYSHQWMDEKGWEHRKVYLQDRSGTIYEATLNIAKGRDRNILYDINNIRAIDKERASDGAVPSTKSGRGSLINRSSGERVSQPEKKVKKKKTKGQLRQEEIQRKKDAGEWTFADEVNEQLESQLRTDDDEEAGYSYENRSLTEDEEVYSYDFLTSQEDMKAVELPEVSEIKDENNEIDHKKVIQKGMENARTVGAEREGEVFVKNNYTGREQRVDVRSIRHGLDGKGNRHLTNARIGAVIGDVVQNAIPINGLKNKGKDVKGTYAMAAYATDSKGREFIAIVTVEQRSQSVQSIELFDVTHSVSGRQKRNSQASTKLQGVIPIKAVSEISIADLLEIVKNTYQSILSEDVLSHFEETRNPDGYYADRVLFSAEDQEAEYEAAVQSGDMETAQRMVDKAAKEAMPEAKTVDAAGKLKHYYHGTARTDRVGNEFRADRATSGPMAFFTDDKAIAENYAKDKADTSMANDPD